MSKELRSLYLHFPFCYSHCNYCDFFSELLLSPSKLLSFQDILLKSWDKHQELLQKEGFYFGPLETLYFGGGTPSLWGKEGIGFFKDFLKKTKLSFAPQYEWTLELNPKAFCPDELLSWEELGVNRYSLGVQTLDLSSLKLLGRTHSREEALDALKQLRGKNFSADLMLGLPRSEKKRNILSELEELLSYDPKHLSVYILTVEKDYLYFHDLPSEEWIENEFLTVSDFLQKNGYSHYEVSNYAKTGFEAQHNLKYWKTESVAALGPTATGLLASENKALRYKWDERAESFSLEELSQKSLQLEKLYMSFRTSMGIDPSAFFVSTDVAIFLKLAEAWKKRGLLKNEGTRFCLTAQGYLLLDSLMDEMFFSLKSF